MKDKFINIKNKIVEFLRDIKNKLHAFVVENKKISAIIGGIAIIIVFAAIGLCNKVETGNTTGNLNNLGFSLKHKGWVYYLGFKDNNTDGIYKIKLNSEKKEKISSDYGFYLNESGNYIYYLDKTSENANIVRMKTNGNDKEIIIKDVDTNKISVVDNWIYYFKDAKFYRAKTNGENKQVLAKKTIYNYEVVGKWIYYSYINEGKYVIAKMKTNGDNITKIDEDSSSVFFVKDSYIYYIYENYDENNYEYNYELYRVKADGKNKKKIVNIGKNLQLEGINFDGDRIYYTKLDENDVLGIYSIKLNGKDERKIVDIQTNSAIINVHDNWVYYIDQNDNGDSDMFRIKTSGKDKQSISL